MEQGKQREGEKGDDVLKEWWVGGCMEGKGFVGCPQLGGMRWSCGWAVLRGRAEENKDDEDD